mmetsp:Transcript_3662/g.3456  ORF Transcript_3662/g.3456 Transcript_3662/m.3456 type:complete len:97 (+) Transcript_3662:260-550(+)
MTITTDSGYSEYMSQDDADEGADLAVSEDGTNQASGAEDIIIDYEEQHNDGEQQDDDINEPHFDEQSDNKMDDDEDERAGVIDNDATIHEGGHGFS